MKSTLAAALALSLAAQAEVSLAPMKGTQTMQLSQEWDKIFPQSNKVKHHKVLFKNRYGITLAGDLYVPKGIKDGAKLPAIAVAGATTGLVLSFIGYKANAVQSQTTLTGIFVIVSIIPAIASLLRLLVLAKYNYTETEFHKCQAILEKRQEED